MVSCIVPVFNAELTIERCINSILNQTYPDIELILIDDGSTDRSGSICKQYVEHDNRVKYYYRENGGAASARNYGMQVASGEWIQFVDSDDYIKSTFTESLLDTVRSQSTDWGICGMEILSLRGRRNRTFGSHICRTKAEMCSVICEHYEAAFVHSCCNKLYKRIFITDYMRTDHVYGEDYIFNLKYMRNISSFSVIDEPLYVYDCTNESVTRGRNRNCADVIKEQYQLTCQLLIDYFNSETLFSVATSLFIKELLADYAANTQIWNIRGATIKSVLQEYQEQLQRITANDYWVEAIRNSDYCNIAHSLRVKKFKSEIVALFKQLFFRLEKISKR